MREIKFRGITWNVNGSSWIEGGYTEIGGKSFIISQKGLSLEVLPETVGQFTGLTDENGKEVYEGDIVISIKCRVSECKGIVAYYGMAFHYEGKQKNGTKWFDTITANMNQDCTVEIIGNIHNNPELLA